LRILRILDKYTIQAVQRAVKHKARKVGRPIAMDGERILYCIRCLKSNYEVQGMLYEPFFTICYECAENLATFVKHLRDREKETAANEET